MNIAVILGGDSAERDVSMKTGQAVIEACKENNFNVETVVIDENYIDSLPILKNVDIVFNALHGTFGEDGTIQRWLESNKILFTGSGSKSSALCMDKIKSKKILMENNFLTPEYFEPSSIKEFPDNYLPCIVKPNSQGSTFGLSYVDNIKDLKKAISHSQEYDKNTLIEKYIYGREITVGIVDGEALPIVEIIPKNKIYDYSCKYTSGMSKYYCPANISQTLTKKIMNDSMEIFNLLGCSGYGRIDYILDRNNDYFFLELNTLPGMTSTSLLPIAATSHGISFNNLVKKIINMGFQNK